MREILFRAKRVDGIWVEGYYFAKPILDYHTIILGDEQWQVDPSTVGQYTGLTDKNGKRIFEGDIIECWSQGVKARGDVRQRIDGLWILYPAFQSNVFWGLCPQGNGTTAVEVIGSIHDNPELLEVHHA
jgi:uncharacterized phage protein (TIGR01671 family)